MKAVRPAVPSITAPRTQTTVTVPESRGASSLREGRGTLEVILVAVVVTVGDIAIDPKRGERLTWRWGCPPLGKHLYLGPAEQSVLGPGSSDGPGARLSIVSN